MLNLTQAAASLGVSERTLVRFDDVPDPFNGGNTLGGFLCQEPDHRYGALLLDSVNGSPVATQRVYCTPKLHYPFGARGEGTDPALMWPTEVVKVEAYEKLDGTNICAYS